MLTMYSEGRISFPTTALALSTVSCCLSIVGSCVIIWTYIWLPEIKNPTRKVFTFLSIADSLTASGYLISSVAWYTNTFQTVCKYQSYLTTFSSLVSFNLTVTIAILLFSTVVYRFDGESKWKLVYAANVLSWLIPAIIIGIAGGEFDVLGKHFTDEDFSNGTAGTGPWCWIDESQPNHVVWMFVTGKGWEILCYLLTTSLYVLLKRYLHLHHRNVSFRDIHPSVRDGDQNFLYVWFVLYVLRIWGTIRFFMKITLCNQQEPCKTIYNEVFFYMQAFGDPAQGFCNFILFVMLDKTVRNELVKVFSQLTSCPREHGINGGADENAGLLEGPNVARNGLICPV